MNAAFFLSNTWFRKCANTKATALKAHCGVIMKAGGTAAWVWMQQRHPQKSIQLGKIQHFPFSTWWLSQSYWISAPLRKRQWNISEILYSQSAPPPAAVISISFRFWIFTTEWHAAFQACVASVYGGVWYSLLLYSFSYKSFLLYFFLLRARITAHRLLSLM